MCLPCSVSCSCKHWNKFSLFSVLLYSFNVWLMNCCSFLFSANKKKNKNIVLPMAFVRKEVASSTNHVMMTMMMMRTSLQRRGFKPLKPKVKLNSSSTPGEIKFPALLCFIQIYVFFINYKSLQIYALLRLCFGCICFPRNHLHD